MIVYSSISGKTTNWYCHKCYEEKLAREKFSDRVCQIFGLKAPGPVIWSQRKKLYDEFGYTDDIILDTLDYVYNVKKIKKISETLYFVRPSIVEEMKKWKRSEQAKAASIIAAESSMTKLANEIFVPVHERKKERKKTNLEDGIFDD